MKVSVGGVLPTQTAVFDRDTLVRYAGASTDFNPIHWSDAAAQALGLPGVIAHGMLTMGAALKVVTDWVGDPTRVVEYYVRFAKPVVVDTTGGAVLETSGMVTAIDGDVATVELRASCSDTDVLGSAVVKVRVD